MFEKQTERERGRGRERDLRSHIQKFNRKKPRALTIRADTSSKCVVGCDPEPVAAWEREELFATPVPA